MSTHAIPNGVDQSQMIDLIERHLRPVPLIGWQVEPPALVFNPDLDATEQATLNAIFERCLPLSTEARALVVQTAQTAVGVRYDLLTAAQVRALFAILLWKEGGLKADGTVRPLAQWVRE